MVDDGPAEAYPQRVNNLDPSRPSSRRFGADKTIVDESAARGRHRAVTTQRASPRQPEHTQPSQQPAGVLLQHPPPSPAVTPKWSAL